LVFAARDASAALRIVACWSDGSREDVTPLCRFRTNDESIATVSPAGRVTAVGPGDTHIVAFYDNGIVPIPVMLPVSEQSGERFPAVPAPTEIDRLVLKKLRMLGIVPADLCGDVEFLRRASLDITGTLPTPAEIIAFLDDPANDKRARKIDELLDRPAHAAWMASRLCELTGNSEQNLPVGGEQNVRRNKSSQWFDWLYRRLSENVPYDQIVEGIVLAVSRRPEQSDEDYFAEMTSYFREADRADFSRRDSMPYFWTPGRFTPPQIVRFSHAFLGVQLECAECHKHPFDQWTQADYQDFQVFFQEVRFRQSPARGSVQELKQSLGLTADQDSNEYRRRFAELAHQGTLVPWGEVVAPHWRTRRPPRTTDKNPSGRVITPRLLGGEQIIAERYTDPREPVMQWLRQPENPYFARAIINRVWAGYFGVGMVAPTDDLNLANPPSNAPLLDWLAAQFVEHGYDLKWLHRTIANSRTYQLDWQHNPTNARDQRNFSRATIRRLPAEVALDAIYFATAPAAEQQALQTDPAVVRSRQIGFPALGRTTAIDAYALKLFGQPTREQACDCERSNEPSLMQTIYLRNDAQLLALLERRDGWLREIQQRDVAWRTAHRDELLREAWLRTVSRPPSDHEFAIAQNYLDRTTDVAAGVRDVLWALLNSKEFLLNH
jgi:hypothetical protein